MRGKTLPLILLKTLLRNLVLPPASLLLLGFLGLALLNRRPRLARVFLSFSLVALWVLSVPAVADALSKLGEHYPALDLSQPTGAQAIVILGGGGQVKRAAEYGGPAARPVLLERLTYGAYVARKTGLPVMVSGAEIEASAMRETLQRNFDISIRWIDDRSGDTFQNAQNSVPILKNDGIERILLVTQSSHMLRSVREFTAAGIQVVPAPTGLASSRGRSIPDYFPDPDGLLHSYYAIYELLGEQVREFFVFTHLRQH
jgi:uncharacterized SAM-binding protein YcdF (DUF218 family)